METLTLRKSRMVLPRRGAEFESSLKSRSPSLCFGPDAMSFSARWMRAFCLVERALAPRASHARSRRRMFLRFCSDALAVFLADGFLFEVVAVVAFVLGQHAALELDDAIGDGVEHVAVVRNQQHGALKRVGQVLFEPGDGLDVEVVGGLVQDGEIRLAHEDLGEGHAAAFAAGEASDLAIPVFVADAEAIEHGVGLVFAAVGQRLRHDLAGGLLVVEDGLLREITNRRVATGLDDAVIGGLESGDDPQEAGFARAVAAEQAHFFAAADGERDVLEEGLRAVGLRDVACGKNGHARRGTLAQPVRVRGEDRATACSGAGRTGRRSRPPP